MTTTAGRGDHPHPPHDAWRSRGFLLRLAHMRWEREVSTVLRPVGLTYVQFALLGGVWWLTRRPGQPPSQRELSDHTGISPMLTSQVTRTLVRDGHVVRTTDATDTRVRRLKLTARGQRLAVRAVRIVDDAEARFFDPIASMEQLAPILRTIAGRDAAGRPLP